MCHDLPLILNLRRSLQNISHIHLILLGYRMRSIFIGKKSYTFGQHAWYWSDLPVTCEGSKGMRFLPLQSELRLVYMDSHCPVFSAACRLYPLFTFVYPYQHRSVRCLCSTLFVQIWCKQLLKWSSYCWHWSTAQVGDRMLAISCYLQSIKLPHLFCLGCETFD